MMCAKVSAFKENERHRGCLPVIASSRAAAVAGERPHTPNLIVLDVHMRPLKHCAAVCGGQAFLINLIISQ